MSARLFVCMVGMSVCGASAAGPLSVQPSVALATEYNSNPDLRADQPQAETIGALMLNTPFSYDEDNVRLALNPAARVSSQKGYSSLGSDFVHIDALAERSSELGSITVQAGFARDSSLVHAGESVDGIGVRTDTTSVGLSWQHAWTERLQLQTDVGWQATSYDQAAQPEGLLDYRYYSASPTLSYAATELTAVQVLASVSHYASVNDLSASNTRALQLGFQRKLTEVWSLSGSAGFALSDNKEKIYFEDIYLETADSRQNGGVYNLSISRKSEVFGLSASATRSYVPSGFGILARQDAVHLQLDDTYSERWSFTAQAAYQSTAYPLTTNGFAALRYFSGDFSANWHWTLECVLSLHASVVLEKYQSAYASPEAHGVSLQIARQFYRMDL